MNKQNFTKFAKLSVLIVVMVLFLSIFVNALEFTLDISPKEQTILSNETAVYDVTISHNNPTTLEYTIYSPDIEWDIYTKPLPVKVPANGQASAKIYIKPIYASAGYHVIPVHIRPTGIDMFQKEFIQLGLAASTEKKQYTPSVRPTISMNSNIDPSQAIPYSIKIQNNNLRELNNIQIKIRSKLINEDYKTKLGAKETKTLDFESIIDKLTAPQKDTLHVTVLVNADNQSYRFDSDPLSYEIIGYGEISSNVQIIKGFLKTTKVITLTNTGNDVKEMTYKIPTSIKHWFTNFQPEFEKRKSVDGNEKNYELDVILQAQSTQDIKIETNYRLSVILLVLLALSLIAYYSFRSPIVLRKTAIVAGTKEGGITDLKVMLYLKNRGKKNIKSVTILDKIPKIAKVKKHFELGSLKPSKIGHDSNGTLLKWSLHDLESLEERIITYHMSSKLTIIGGMDLPVAVVKFKHGKNIRKTRSNLGRIGFSVK